MGEGRHPTAKPVIAATHESGTACLNCGWSLIPGANYCSQCGQDTANHPPTLFEFVHEFVSHYVAAEGKLWKSLWALMCRPGFLTLEYLAGRKQRYVLPLRLLLSLGLVFFLVAKYAPVQFVHMDDEWAKKVQQSERANAMADVASVPSLPASAALAPEAEATAKSASVKVVPSEAVVKLDDEMLSLLSPGLRAKVQEINAHWQADPMGSAKGVGSVMLSLAPYAVLCSLPFFAGLLKLFFRSQPYGAHFVFAMHLHAAWYGMLLIAVLLPWQPIGLGVWGWANLYPLFALKRVHAASWVATALRAGLLAVLHWLVLAVGLVILALAGIMTTA